MVLANGYRAGFPVARPLPAGGGVALEKSSAEFGNSWWSRRFLELLESFGLGTRLERGREYARTGQVLELDIEPGIALAKVQGSRFTPYRVRIRPQTFSEYQWRRAEKAIAARALTLARLLAGEMPNDIEDVLAGARLPLLPSTYAELPASCACPDEANPCMLGNVCDLNGRSGCARPLRTEPTLKRCLTTGRDGHPPPRCSSSKGVQVHRVCGGARRLSFCRDVEHEIKLIEDPHDND